MREKIKKKIEDRKKIVKELEKDDEKRDYEISEMNDEIVILANTLFNLEKFDLI